MEEITHKRSRTPYFCCERSRIAFSTARHIFIAERSFSVPQKSTRDRGRVGSRARLLDIRMDFRIHIPDFLSKFFE